MSRILPKAQTTNISGQNSNTGEVQANVVTDQGKAVVGRLHLGAATPRVRLHPCHCLPGPLCSCDNINAPRVDLGGFLIYLTQTDHGALYKKKLPPSMENNTQERKSTKEVEEQTPHKWA